MNNTTNCNYKNTSPVWKYFTNTTYIKSDQFAFIDLEYRFEVNKKLIECNLSWPEWQRNHAKGFSFCVKLLDHIRIPIELKPSLPE